MFFWIFLLNFTTFSVHNKKFYCCSFIILLLISCLPFRSWDPCITGHELMMTTPWHLGIVKSLIFFITLNTSWNNVVLYYSLPFMHVISSFFGAFLISLAFAWENSSIVLIHNPISMGRLDIIALSMSLCLYVTVYTTVMCRIHGFVDLICIRIRFS